MPLDRTPESAYAAHRTRCEEMQAALARESSSSVALAKQTSNLFRDRSAAAARRLDVRRFDHVLRVDAAAGWVDAEGMTPYDRLADACLAHGVMPAVVPELKSITLGGAAAGVGIEATSFRYGLVHDTLTEVDVLTGSGEIVTATRDNAHADLFYGFPNSYGTLGYALRLRARVIPVRRHVRVEHRRFDAPRAFFAALAQACAGPADFIDGVVFAPDCLVLNSGTLVDDAPYASDYTYEHIYYRSLLERPLDFMTVRDYLWRWDTDWFWCSKNLGAQNPWLRKLYGRKRLNSRTYQRIMRANSRLGLMRALEGLSGWHRESIIQDVDIPIDGAADFLAFFQREVGITPVWVCPIGAVSDCDRFALFPRARGLYVNFGFWDVKRTRQKHAAGHFNRLVEAEVLRLGGIKSLYSDSFFTLEAFENAYGGEAYRALKARYDPRQRLGDLYSKCVLRD